MKKSTKSHSLKRTGRVLLIIAMAILLFIPAYHSQACSITKNPDGLPWSLSPAGGTRDTVYTWVDEMPVFPGGEQALLDFIATNAKYPEDAKRDSITGKVIVKFILEKDCTVSSPEVLKSVNPDLDAEALRVVGLLPKFQKPAMYNGKRVAVYCMVPITFALK